MKSPARDRSSGSISSRSWPLYVAAPGASNDATQTLALLPSSLREACELQRQTARHLAQHDAVQHERVVT